ncbi:MAG: S-layer homology domain-containing protein [Clostridia bacterium]|nr:S-layer homology domain-containing protein [Clostridia bacterium]
MKKIAIFLLLILALSSVTATASPVYGDWAKESIEQANLSGLLRAELISGDFTKPVSRIEIAEFIVKAYENITNEPCYAVENPFEDTQNRYASAISKLGIMSGRGEGIFSPYDYVTRQEMSKIILTFKALAENVDIDFDNYSVPEFTDMKEVSTWAVPYVSGAYENGIIKGYEDSSFKPLGTVSYQEAISLILRAAKLNYKTKPVIETPENGVIIKPSQSLKLSVVSTSDYKVYAYDVQSGYVNRIGSGSKGRSFSLRYDSFNAESMYRIFVESDGVYSEFISVYTDKYNLFIDSENFVSFGMKKISWNSIPGLGTVTVTVTEQRNSRHEGDIPPNVPYTYNVENQNSINVMMYPNCIYTIEISSGEYNAQKQIVCESVNGEKSKEIYDTYPATKEEADLLMVEIAVPVWRLSGNKKVSSTAYLTVHKDIAEKVRLVFEEIYNGAEKFPVKDVGGYNWRGGTTEHNGGTAIDINSNENYCIYSNGTVVGSHWLPYEDPYSITPYGDVVRAFEKYGFTWGGDAWNSTKDYMHFSYLGT